MKSYLGLLNYYGRFLPNLSSLIQPLNQLQSKDQKWEWSTACQQAFESSKQALVSSSALTSHYDATKPLQLACDAFPFGVGAVLSQYDADGTERPVAFASRTLSTAEKNYAQIEREALAIIFGVRKFHQYLYGRVFTLFTNHKPLTSILGPKTGIRTYPCCCTYAAMGSDFICLSIQHNVSQFQGECQCRRHVETSVKLQ